MDMFAISSTDSSLASAPFRGRAPPTAQDWEDIRHIFTQLYSVENQELKAVMRILQVKHGFHATKRMYNKRINDWKIHKNYKKSEKAAMIQAFKVKKASYMTPLQRGQILARDIQRTGLTFKGQPIKVDRLVRYMKEMHSSNDDLGPLFGRQVHPTRLITDYGETRDAETLFKCASQYLDFYIASKIALRPSESQNMPHGIETTLLANDDEVANVLVEQSDDFDCKLDNAIMLHMDGRFPAAFRELNEAMDGVRYLFSTPHPSLLSRFFRILLFRRSVAAELIQTVWNFVTDMAKTMLGSNHPIVVACAVVQILTIHDSKMAVWRTLNDILRDGLGAKNRDITRAQGWYLITLFRFGRYEEASQDLDCRLAGNEISEHQYLDCQGVVLAGSREYGKAELNLRKTLEMNLKIWDDALLSGNLYNRGSFLRCVYAMTNLAIVLEFRGKYVAAKEQCLEALGFSCQTIGLFDCETCRIVSCFERFLQRRGQYEEAAAFRCQYPHVFQ